MNHYILCLQLPFNFFLQENFGDISLPVLWEVRSKMPGGRGYTKPQQY